MITHLQEIVETLKDNKFKLAEDLEEKDKIIFEMKKKEENNCPNNCEKYSKSIDEIFQAGTKHREKLIALKKVADDQKKKMSILQEEKLKLHRLVTNFQKENLNFKQEIREWRNKVNTREETIKEHDKKTQKARQKFDFVKTKLETCLKEYQTLENNSKIKNEELEKGRRFRK